MGDGGVLCARAPSLGTITPHAVRLPPRSDERAAVPPGLCGSVSGCTGHGRAWQAARAMPSAPGFRACGARAGQTRGCSAPEELALEAISTNFSRGVIGPSAQGAV